MRLLTGKLFTGKPLTAEPRVGERPAGKLLNPGLVLAVALAAWTAPRAMARDEVALAAPDQPVRVAQVAPPGSVTPDQSAGQDPNTLPPLMQPAAPPPPAEIPRPFHGSVSFEAGSGKILTLTLPAANIYVADPKVAEVRPASSTSLFVFGVGPGRTTIAAVDLLGRLLAEYEITVRPSAYGAREAQSAIARLIPGSRIEVKPQGKGMMLTGAVATASDAQQAMLIAKGFSGGDLASVENQMTIASATQVTLMVRIAEMKRSIVRNLGIDWSAQGFLGKIAPLGGVPGAATHLLQSTFNGTQCATGRLCFDAVLNALAKDGLAHVLAEPNLTVMSGQSASFQSGGEYPYPVLGGSGGNNNQVTIAFKPYGVLLNFVPTVLSDGRINLHVRPEVSELDTTNLLAIQTGSSQTLAAPALIVRRAETTVELGSGESLAIAGMLQTTNSDNGAGIPGIGDTPILGALFRTSNMSREQTELVIVVTPILVRPVRNVAQLQIPGDGYKPPGDIDRLLWMRQVPNRDGTIPPPAAGQAGFIVR